MTTPTGEYYEIHSNAGLNFNLNRLALTIPVEELRQTASKIESLEDWIKHMTEAGSKAENEGRYLHAARYYQGAEFYMANGREGKLDLYLRSLALFDKAVPELSQYRDSVAYDHGQLPVIRLSPPGSNPHSRKETILIHSGYDGLVEEMYPTLQPMVDVGYTVIAFEGPGQGAALRKSNLHMPSNWDKPVAAILDHYAIESCTLVGMSLGGYLAPSAAAFEKRIKRVVAWGAMHTFYSAYEKRLDATGFRVLTMLLNLGMKKLVNRIMERAAEKESTLKWALAHGKHVSGTDNAFDFLQWVRSLSLDDKAELIDQDVLIMMGNEDHLIPSNQLYIQAESMVNARSVTSVMFSATDQAAKHCQVGNTTLAVNQILAWLEFLENRDHQES